MKLFLPLSVFFIQVCVSASDQYPPGVPPSTHEEIKFHEPQPPPPQRQQQYQADPGLQQPGGDANAIRHGRGVGGVKLPSKHHTNLHVDMEKEREHMKSHIREEYIDKDKMDDMALLMQYFRKHDYDKNHRLDGNELIKAISRLSDEDHDHHDEGEEEEARQGADEDDGPADMSLADVVPIVDEILREDDKNNDGFISWSEFISRQKAKMKA